ncbi:MAG: YeeE/YedE family protein [Pseudomonadota bacterium]
MSITFNILLSGFAAALLFGVVSHRTDFCTMGAVSDWINIGDQNRLRAWILASLTALTGMLLLEALGLISLDTTRPPYRVAVFEWLRYPIGGIMFGIGMVLASGCASKTLVRLGSGNLKSLVVFIVIGLCAWAMTKTAFYENMFYPWINGTSINLAEHDISGQDLGSLLAGLTPLESASQGRLIFGIPLALLAAWWIFKSAEFRTSYRNLFAGVFVGCFVIAGWYITGKPWPYDGEMMTWAEAAEWMEVQPASVGAQSYTFVNPMGETFFYLMRPTDFSLITFGMTAAAGVMFGAFVSALLAGRLRLEWFQSFADFRNHVIGAALMGIGGVLTMGCTIGQGVSGVSTMALGSFLTIGIVLFSSALTMKVLYYQMLDESFFNALRHSLADFFLPKKI